VRWNRPVSRPWITIAIVALAVVAAKMVTGFDPFPRNEPVRATGSSWPDGEIRYFNAAPEHAWAVQQAVDAWNLSGVHVHFVPTERTNADVVIKSAPVEKCGHGLATLGYAPNARATIFRPGDGPGCDRYSAARVLAHELGHIVGLDHDDSHCAAMNTSGNRRGSVHCKPSPPWEWHCRLLEQTDLAAAAKLYGGTPKSTRGDGNCNLYAPVQPPAEVRFLPERSSPDRLAFSFLRPADSLTPAFLHGFVQPSYQFAFVNGPCGKRPVSPRYRWSVAPGSPQIALFPVLGKGTHCLRLWAADQMGRLSDRYSTIEAVAS